MSTSTMHRRRRRQQRRNEMIARLWMAVVFLGINAAIAFWFWSEFMPGREWVWK